LSRFNKRKSDEIQRLANNRQQQLSFKRTQFNPDTEFNNSIQYVIQSRY